MITVEYLKSILRYDPITGHFYWLIGIGGTYCGARAGGLKRRGYRMISIRNKSYSAHRLAWLYTYGSWPAGQIDHKDCCKDNNAIENLREADNSLNQANTKSRNPLGKGVTRNRGRYQAHIKKNGRTIYLGLFDDPAAAHAAYCKAASVIFGNYARAE